MVSIPRRATKGKWRKTYLGRPSRRRPAVPKDGKLKGTSGGPKASPKPPPRSKDTEPVVRNVAHVTTVPPQTTATTSSKSLRPTLPPVEPKATHHLPHIQPLLEVPGSTLQMILLYLFMTLPS